MGEFITSGEGDFFVQTERAEPFANLTCVGVGDLPLPLGDLTPVYCPDPAQKGKFVIEGFIQGEAGAGTVTLTRPLSAVANWLLENRCGFEALVTYACRGTRALPQNYEIAAVLIGAQPTTNTLMAAVAQIPADNDRVQTSVDISYTDRPLIYHLAMSQQDLTNDMEATDIAFLPEACESRCGPARLLCEEGYITLDGTGLYSAGDVEIKYTTNGGGAWNVAPDPFVYGGGASSVVVVETADGHRAIVARGEPIDGGGGGSPAEVAYRDVAYGADWATVAWTNVWVGTVLGQTIQDLFYYGGRVWAAASGGYIYSSNDLAGSWTALEDGSVVQDVNGICMYSLQTGYAVGNSNSFWYTTNGTVWNTDRTGPADAVVNLRSVAVNDKGHVFVGAADGSLYVSEDGGQNWVLRHAFGTGVVDWIEFDAKHRYFGGLIYNTGAPVGTLYRSIDGGASWQAPQPGNQPDNNGLNSGFVCDQNHIFVVGDLDDAGDTFVAYASPAT